MCKRISRKATDRAFRLAASCCIATVLATCAASFAGREAALALPGVIEVRAQSRATGNDRPDALRIARALLGTVWPAQIIRVRVDAARSHRIAGIVISGLKFHRPLDPHAFDDEIAAVANRALDAAPVEEVDLWATVPLDAGAGTVVSGDLAKPTSRIVFSVTVPRSARASLRKRLAARDDVYWDSAFRTALERKAR